PGAGRAGVARVPESGADAWTKRIGQTDVDRIGPPGSPPPADDVRADVHRTPRQPFDRTPIRSHVPHVDPARDAAGARPRRLRRRSGARRLSGSSLGRGGGRVDSAREKEVEFRSLLVFSWSSGGL